MGMNINIPHISNTVFWDMSLVTIDVSEERVPSVFRVERISDLGMLAVTNKLHDTEQKH
jgi:hypothetical protein